jgi:hypothetical protein
MGYLIAVVLLLLLVTGFVTFLVLRATRKSNPAAPDESQAGDTTEHAGSHSERGHTAHPEGAGEGGDGDGHRDTARPGEGEGSRAVPEPESERLGNRG